VLRLSGNETSPLAFVFLRRGPPRSREIRRAIRLRWSQPRPEPENKEEGRSRERRGIDGGTAGKKLPPIIVADVRERERERERGGGKPARNIVGFLNVE